MNTSPILLLAGTALGALLGAAVWHDVRTRRIPNGLVLGGALAGLALNAALPAGASLFADPPGGLGLLASLAGLGLGLATLLPMYALGAMGAGDVKLMAMVGAFLGPDGVLGAALLSLLTGGVLALAMALWMGALPQVLGNLCLMLRHSLLGWLLGNAATFEPPPASTGQLAYAIAIAGGTAITIVLVHAYAWSPLP